MNDIKILIKTIVLFAVQPFYWTLVVQQASNWVFQAQKMDRRIFDMYTLKPDQIHAITPILVIVLIPTFNYLLYPCLSIRTPTQKMSIGLMCAMFSSICATLLEKNLDETISIVWQLPQYIFLSFSEVMFVLNGYELAYTNAPTSMKAVVQACYLFTILMGNLMVAIVASIGLTKTHEYILFTIAMAVNVLIWKLITFKRNRIFN